MPQIIRPITGSINNTCLELERSHIARYMVIGPEWTKLRIGVLWCLNSTGLGDITGTPRLGVGVCANLDNPYGSLVPDHWVGLVSNSADWGDRTNVYGSTSFTSGFVMNPGKVVSGVSVISASTVVGLSIASTPSSRMSAFVMEIEKIGANFSFQAIAPGDGAASNITTVEMLRSSTEAAVLEAFTNTVGGGYTIGTKRTLAVDESTDGLLNAININYDVSTLKLQIYDIFYAKM